MKLFHVLISAVVSFSAVAAAYDQVPLPPLCPPAKVAHPFYRAYSSAATDHFYTTDEPEYENAVANLGYSPEGIACNIFIGDVGGGTVPLYRLYNNKWLDHFYTTNAAERDNAVVNLGFTSEGTAGYVYTDGHCGGIPLYRLYQPTILDHFYTTSANERDNAIQNLGYSNEGIAAYVIPA